MDAFGDCIVKEVGVEPNCLCEFDYWVERAGILLIS